MRMLVIALMVAGFSLAVTPRMGFAGEEVKDKKAACCGENCKCEGKCKCENCKCKKSEKSENSEKKCSCGCKDKK